MRNFYGLIFAAKFVRFNTPELDPQRADDMIYSKFLFYSFSIGANISILELKNRCFQLDPHS